MNFEPGNNFFSPLLSIYHANIDEDKRRNLFEIFFDICLQCKVSVEKKDVDSIITPLVDNEKNRWCAQFVSDQYQKIKHFPTKI